MADASLPLAYTDPHTFLALRNLHRSLAFRPSWLGPDDAPHRITYASVGNPSGPLLVV